MRLDGILLLLCTINLSLTQAQTLNFYAGNIHSHTAFSDGNKDSASSGVYDPQGSFAYAKLSDDFDFLGISEHNHYSSSHNPGFRRPLYQIGLAMADQANEEGSFLALFGMEYGVSSQYNGHVILYGFDKLLGWENSVPGVSGNNYEVFNAKTDYQGLFQKVNGTPGAFAWLAHPSFDDFTTDGTWQTALSNAPYNPSFDSAIVGMPLRSGLATNPGDTYSDYPQSHYFNYYKKLLHKGYHLGIGYDHDNHFTNFGRGNAGRLIMMAPSLTRASFYQAMREMRFYGSDDSNARISFSCRTAAMGAIAAGQDFPALTLSHVDGEGEDADTIKLWRGYKDSPGLWAQVVAYTTGNNIFSFTDSSIVSDREYFYFAEVRQRDGQWIVTSPIWYTKSQTALIAESNRSLVLIRYDVNHSKLHISCPLTGPYSLRIYDLNGKMVANRPFESQTYVAELAELHTGLYLAVLDAGEWIKVQRFVKE